MIREGCNRITKENEKEPTLKELLNRYPEDKKELSEFYEETDYKVSVFDLHNLVKWDHMQYRNLLVLHFKLDFS